MQDPTDSDALRVQLRRARKAARLTQEQLAARLGITGVQVSRIETGARGTGLDLARRWLEECGYTVESVSVGEPDTARTIAIAIATLDEAELEAVTRVVGAWPRLPEHIREAILSLIGPHEPD